MVEIQTQRPISLELYKDYKELGRFMLRYVGSTIAAGVVTEVTSAQSLTDVHSHRYRAAQMIVQLTTHKHGDLPNVSLVCSQLVTAAAKAHTHTNNE